MHTADPVEAVPRLPDAFFLSITLRTGREKDLNATPPNLKEALLPTLTTQPCGDTPHFTDEETEVRGHRRKH